MPEKKKLDPRTTPLWKCAWHRTIHHLLNTFLFGGVVFTLAYEAANGIVPTVARANDGQQTVHGVTVVGSAVLVTVGLTLMFALLMSAREQRNELRTLLNTADSDHKTAVAETEQAKAERDAAIAARNVAIARAEAAEASKPVKKFLEQRGKATTHLERTTSRGADTVLDVDGQGELTTKDFESEQ